ncbi:DUF6190 family protein [Pseudomonas sp. KNUC1026]|uniref:DUF6190 family protein n=1 Tax=Pseudomonas sp. KNUC1026 TaxID=2893890 RepID=UPI001F3A23B5|nr:DUF6190 family protein [Pseudomonas sp. KNUC1026]UFH51140.1 DUF6190 family protein [Pseudomonas sp. KNUC1026]
MPDATPIIDASWFMGMHHQQPELRARSLAFFTGHYLRQAWMSFSQIGICDAIIWKKPRELQDLYYPFMDVLHSQMRIQRAGYSDAVVLRAASDEALAALPTEKRLLAAHVLECQAPFFTHDLDFLACPALQPWLAQPNTGLAPGHFPEGLQRLYEASLALSIQAEDLEHV